MNADHPGSVWDSGLQPERTRLAWQRTALALLTAALVVARVVGHHNVPAGIAVAAAACVLAGGIGVLTTRRYLGANRRLSSDRPLQGALIHLLLTGVLVVIGVGALIYVLVP